MVTRGPRFSASRQPTIRTCCSWMAALRPRTIHGSEPYSFRKGGSFRVFVQPCVKSRRKECPSRPRRLIRGGCSPPACSALSMLRFAFRPALGLHLEPRLLGLVLSRSPEAAVVRAGQRYLEPAGFSRAPRGGFKVIHRSSGGDIRSDRRGLSPPTSCFLPTSDPPSPCYRRRHSSSTFTGLGTSSWEAPVAASTPRPMIPPTRMFPAIAEIGRAHV